MSQIAGFLFQPATARGGFGVLALVMAPAGRRISAGWPRRAGWAFLATSARVGSSELARGAMFSQFYLALGAAALVGQIPADRD